MKMKNRALVRIKLPNFLVGRYNPFHQTKTLLICQVIIVTGEIQINKLKNKIHTPQLCGLLIILRMLQLHTQGTIDRGDEVCIDLENRLGSEVKTVVQISTKGVRSIWNFLIIMLLYFIIGTKSTNPDFIDEGGNMLS